MFASSPVAAGESAVEAARGERLAATAAGSSGGAPAAA